MARKIISKSYEAPPTPPTATSPAPQSLVRVKPSDIRARKAPPVAPTPAPAAAATAGKPMTKSDFIRSRPTLSAAEIVVDAAKHGHTISQAMVYTVRGRAIPTRGRGRPRKHPLPVPAAAGASGVTAVAPAAPKRVTAAKPIARSGNLSTTEMEMARLLLEIGLDRSEQLLAQLRRALS